MDRKKLFTGGLMLALFFSSFAVYMHTAAPTLAFGDSGELISAVSTLGIPHPTGFPAYILSGRIFSMVMPGNPALRLNMMSAFFGALTVSLLFLALLSSMKDERDSILRYFLAGIISALFIFSYTLWSQSAMARIYTLNSAFCAGALFLFFRYREDGSPRWLYMLGLLTGLGSGLHLTFILLSVFLWLWLLASDSKNIKKWLGWTLFFAFTGLLVYLYIPIRGSKEVALRWQEITNLKQFFYYMTQRQYGSKMATRDLDAYLSFFGYMKDVLLRELSPIALVLFTAGLVTGFIRKRSSTLLMLSVFLANILVMGLYGNYADLKLSFRYLIPSYAAMMFVIAWLFCDINSYTRNPRNTVLVASVLCATMAVLALPVNSHEASKRDNYIAYNFAKDILSTLPAGKATLFASGDNLIYPLAYFKITLGMYPNVTVMDNTDTIFKESKPLIEKSKSNQTLHNVLTALSDGYPDIYSATMIGSRLFYENPWGLLYRITPEPEPAQDWQWKTFPLKGITSGPAVFHDFEEREVVGTYLYRLSEYYRGRNDLKMSEALLARSSIAGYDSVPVLAGVAMLYSFSPYIDNYFKKAEALYLQAYKLNPANYSLVFNMGSFYGRMGMAKNAVYYFERAVKLDPYNYTAKQYLAKALEEMRMQADAQEQAKQAQQHYESGKQLLAEKRLDEAMVEFVKDTELFPELGRSYFHIGLIYSMKNQIKNAIPYYEKSLKKEPMNAPALSNIGLCYIRLKDYKKAADYFEKSLAIDPNQERVKKDLERLRQFLNQPEP
ncbi:MAG: DUF2723 domain-containing protein [Spirochaetia bacterium]|nr:DUF2723 domain-containing protein [Spirochaetia bacterium]